MLLRMSLAPSIWRSIQYWQVFISTAALGRSMVKSRHQTGVVEGVAPLLMLLMFLGHGAGRRRSMAGKRKRVSGQQQQHRGRFSAASTS